MFRGTLRRYHSRAEHTEWVRRVVRSRLERPAQAVQSADAAPFLSQVEPMYHRLRCLSAVGVPARSPAASMVEAVWPVSTDALLQNAVADLHEWSPARLSKFYEALDALTADAAYRHVNSNGARELTVVTAGHYNSLKLGRTQPGRDVRMRCYVTATGSSSIEVRTDALQLNDAGAERLVNVCHTVMVTLDAATMQPAAGSVPPLAPDAADARQDERAALAALHKGLRQQRERENMGLRAKISHPPTLDEMAVVHELHRAVALVAERPQNERRAHRRPDTVAFHTHASCFVVFPEQRNVHGKMFGGWVAGTAYDVAYYAARFFARGAPFVPLGLDEATFLQPVSVGDMVRLEASVVHAAEGLFRVNVNVSVVDPADPGRLPRRTNRLMFVFATDRTEAPVSILPETYAEILLHVDAARRHAVEGPSETTWQQLDEFFRATRKAAAAKGPGAVRL